MSCPLLGCCGLGSPDPMSEPQACAQGVYTGLTGEHPHIWTMGLSGDAYISCSSCSASWEQCCTHRDGAHHVTPKPSTLEGWSRGCHLCPFPWRGRFKCYVFWRSAPARAAAAFSLCQVSAWKPQRCLESDIFIAAIWPSRECFPLQEKQQLFFTEQMKPPVWFTGLHSVPWQPHTTFRAQRSLWSTIEFHC